MNLRQLRYFEAIAEEGSLSGAAQRLRVAQPSLSQQVRKLEAELGVDLLERSSRGVTLTEAGAVLRERAVAILSDVERACADVRQTSAEPMGEVSFGLPSSVSMVLTVPLAETVRLELPKVKLRIAEAMSGTIEDWLARGAIDLGILYDVGGVRHLSHRPLLTEALSFFAAPDAWPFDTAPGSPVPLADLARTELVLPSKDHGLRIMIERVASAAGVALDVVAEMDALTQIKVLVARGSGQTILAPAAAHDAVARNELVSGPIVAPEIARTVHLVRNPTRPRTRAAHAVERVAGEVIADLVARGIWQANALPTP